MTGGDGADSLTDSDATVGNLDQLRFGADISSNQLWFRKAGADLEISVIGSSDKTTLKNWYTGSANHIEQIRSGDGKVLTDTHVDSLVQAMSAFTPPAAGQIVLPQNYQTALAPLLAANWA